MKSGTHNITIEAGANFKVEIQWADSIGNSISTADKLCRMEVKQAKTDSTPLIRVNPYYNDATISNIQHNDNGLITIDIKASDTKGLGITTGYWDLEIVDELDALSGSITFTNVGATGTMDLTNIGANVGNNSAVIVVGGANSGQYKITSSTPNQLTISGNFATEGAIASTEVYITNEDEVIRLLEGKVTYSGEVTTEGES